MIIVCFVIFAVHAEYRILENRSCTRRNICRSVVQIHPVHVAVRGVHHRFRVRTRRRIELFRFGRHILMKETLDMFVKRTLAF